MRKASETWMQGWMMQKQSSILSAAGVIGLSVAGSSITGLMSNRILTSHFYDATSLTQPILDSYWVAFQPSDMMFQLLVAGAMSASFIPVFSQIKKSNAREAFAVANTVLNGVLLIFALASLALFIFAPSVLSFITGSAFQSYQIELSSSLLRVLIFAQIFFVFSNFFSGMLQSYQRFVIPAFSPILYNCGIIFGTLFFSQSLGIFAPAIGAVIGAFLHMIVQIPLLRRLGYRYECTLHFRHQGAKKILQLAIPRAFSTGVDLLFPAVLTFFITSMQGANLTLMKFAQKLMIIPIRLFGVPIGQASLPFLADQSDDRDRGRFNTLVLQSLRQVLYLALPASALLLILRIPIVRFAYGAKNFPWGDTVLGGKIVLILALSIAFQSCTHVLTRAFFALHDTKRPFYISLATLVIGVFAGWYVSLQLQWGLLGIALIISGSGMIETIALFVMLILRTQMIRSQLFPFFAETGKMLIATLLMGFGLYSALKLLDIVVIDTTKTLGLITLTVCVTAVGMIVYLFMTWLMKIEELRYVTAVFEKTGLWKPLLRKQGVTKSMESIGEGIQEV
ncbi:MAG: Integral membrane protein mvin [Microgenomates group bacterium GW2011_GWF2_45_18]|nr:MAG: Integral membrane protein mvin [Microgenomates group bacterium GW2011_GWF1_44_10]KKU01589.1 MAG: Integral membrane protein mvin [Microgenomates group bacterium GW2011_GWF2_45_18]